MSWQQERRWGQAWTVLAALAIAASILVRKDDLSQVVLVLIGILSLGIAAHHGYQSLQKEAEEKGWPRGR